MDEFDVIVIGAGPAGESCAGSLRAAGLDVALAETDLFGGECAFYSCMPSKALLRPGELMREVERTPGVADGDVQLDSGAVLDHRDEIIGNLNDSSHRSGIERTGITLLPGPARLTGERQVEVNGRPCSARRAIVIATGSRAAIPPIEGLAEIEPWTNRTGTTADSVPGRLIVLGGGPVGCELAQAWASLGSRVTLIDNAERVLAGEEQFASELVTDALTAAGVKVVTATEAQRFERVGSGEIEVALSNGDSVTADEVLVATGREANIEDLGLESVGIEEPSGSLEVDDRMRVQGRDDLYAVGDVNGRSLLTHIGKYQAGIASDSILGAPTVARDLELGAPRVTFTDPNVAAAGKTSDQARDEGIDIATSDAATSATPAARFYGRKTPSRSRIVVDRDREVIIGATFVGYETLELVHAATVAIAGAVPLPVLRHAVPAFPTRSEVWLKLLDGIGA